MLLLTRRSALGRQVEAIGLNGRNGGAQAYAKAERGQTL